MIRTVIRRASAALAVSLLAACSTVSSEPSPVFVTPGSYTLTQIWTQSGGWRSVVGGALCPDLGLAAACGFAPVTGGDLLLDPLGQWQMTVRMRTGIGGAEQLFSSSGRWQAQGPSATPRLNLFGNTGIGIATAGGAYLPLIQAGTVSGSANVAPTTRIEIAGLTGLSLAFTRSTSRLP